MKRSDTQLAQVWRDRFATYKDSGLSVAQFCSLHGLHVRNYYYWKCRLQKLRSGELSAIAPALPPTWISLTPDLSATDIVLQPLPQSSTLVLKIAGAEIELDASFNPSLLRAVVSALSVTSC